MRKLTCTIAGAALMFFACSPDAETQYYQQVASIVPPSELMPLSPENVDNPYDHVGPMFQETVSRHLNGQNAATGKGTGQEYGDSGPWQTLAALLANSGLSPDGQVGLLGFVETILTQQHEGYPILYTTIVDFETWVMDQSGLTVFDKQVILTFASLVRHATYPDVTAQTSTEVEDEDWDLSVGNAIGLIYLALEHTYDGDTSSLAPSKDTGTFNPVQ